MNAARTAAPNGMTNQVTEQVPGVGLLLGLVSFWQIKQDWQLLDIATLCGTMKSYYSRANVAKLHEKMGM